MYIKKYEKNEKNIYIWKKKKEKEIRKDQENLKMS